MVTPRYRWRLLRWSLVAVLLLALVALVACSHMAENCEDLGTCPPDGGVDAGDAGAGGASL
jgi:hypothetical protein